MDEKEIEIIAEEEVKKADKANGETETEKIAAEEVKAETEVKELETYKEMSPLRLVLRRFFRSKLSIVGLVMIAFLFILCFVGPTIYTRWKDGKNDLRDERPIAEENEVVRSYDDIDGNKITATEIVTIDLPVRRYQGISLDHLLGTDDEGYDVFTRLMEGGKISLTIGFIVVILETLIGVILGGIAGYFGGMVDQIIMRIVDIFNCVPTLPILLIAASVIKSWEIPPESNANIYLLMVMITIFSWSGVARLVRGQILMLREQEYMTATEVMGIPVWRRIFVHLLPNVMPQLIVSMTLGLGSVILYESTLSYLGLGIQHPKAAWGTMIAKADIREILQYHVNVWLPAGIMIVIAVLGFNFVGDGLRDAMDPKARK